MDSGDQHDIQPGISAAVFAPLGQSDLDAAVLDLAAVLDGLVFDNFEIIVVETAPTDRVSKLVADLRMRFPQLPLRSLAGQHPDQASALSAAFAAAGYDLIFVTSADGQYDMRELNHLLDAIEHGADLAIGYRPKRAGSLLQRLDGWGWNLLVNAVFGPTAHDVDCGFKLFRQAVWRCIGMRSRGTATFYTELLVRARRLGFRVTEVAVNHHRSAPDPRPDAATPVAIWRALLELQDVRRRVVKPQSPCDAPTGSGRPVSGRAA
ncbi:MAG: glycosyltransferase [Chloroflexi bacterium]|nr:glycosyltransferase [Chloroflexota bacterium]